MKLAFDDIFSLVHGAEQKFEADGTAWFLRFTEEQRDFYRDIPEMYDKAAASAGIHLDFMTNSRFLKLELDTVHADGVSEFWIDFYADGKHLSALQADLADSKNNRLMLTQSVELPAGNKRVSVYFPWTGCTGIRSLELEDGAAFEPIRHKLKMLMYGDSITHGSWAKDASALYAVRLSHALDAEGINKGLGGDVMRVGFPSIRGNISPDIITVAYGTNDWTDHVTPEAMAEKSRSFYAEASATYPDARIFAISPIWRNNADTAVKKVGSFKELGEILKHSAEGLPNVTFIDGYDLVPHLPEMFSPDLLHPSDLGFEHYAKNLLQAMKPYLA